MKLIPLTQDKIAIIDDEDYNLISYYKWSAHKDNRMYYARAWGKERKKMLRMHRVIMNAKSNQQIDHINHNGLDNRKSNLRFVNQNQQSQNSRKFQSKTTSKYKGVRYQWKKWEVNIQRDYIGRFDEEIDAAKAYNKEAIKRFGKYACLNQIENIEK